MSYNVFISYSSVDKPWAEKLAKGLEGRGLKVFYDSASLRDGVEWESQLNVALLESQHMVCFWSAHAHASAWVQSELGTFRAEMTRNPSSGARLFMISLDSKQQNSFARIQQLDDPAVKTAYAAGGVSAMSNADWIALVDRVERGVRSRSASLQVPVALLTLDRSSLPFNAADAQQIETDLGLTASQMNLRYGDRHVDWVPFADGLTIESHLEASRARINAWLAASPATQNESMDWELPDGRFWSKYNLDNVREFAGRMENGQPGLIIIDPVATLLSSVQLRLAIFNRCLKLGNVAIIAPHPSPATAQDNGFRQWMSNYTVALLDEYVSPRPVPDFPVFARFGIGVDDVNELRRLLQTSIGDVLRRRGATAIPAAAAIRN